MSFDLSFKMQNAIVIDAKKNALKKGATLTGMVDELNTVKIINSDAKNINC